MSRAGGPRAVKRNLSLWSRRGYAEIDGRLLEARAEKAFIRELTEHVGGKPTITQGILIKRSARLLIMIEQLERRMIEGNELGDLGGRQICALHNLRLSLTALGIERVEQQAPQLSAFLASQRGRAA